MSGNATYQLTVDSVAPRNGLDYSLKVKPARSFLFKIVLVPIICCTFPWLPPLAFAQAVKVPDLRTQSAKASHFEDQIDGMVDRFSTSGKTALASAVELAYRYQLPMAVEFADRDATARPLNLEFHNQAVRKILEAIVQQVPQYRVSFSEGIVDIFSPKAREDSSNLLNATIKDFSVTEMETRKAEFQLFCAIVSKIESSGCAGSLAVGQWEPIRITLNLRNVKVYQVLNAIVAQNGKLSGRWWLVHQSFNLGAFGTSIRYNSLLRCSLWRGWRECNDRRSYKNKAHKSGKRRKSAAGRYSAKIFSGNATYQAVRSASQLRATQSPLRTFQL
jgi:hypothetical protein